MIQVKGPRDRAIGIFVALLFANWFLLTEIMNLMHPALYLILIVIDVLGVLMIWHDCKTVSIDASGCTVSIFLWKKFYPWYMMKTIRYLDFGQERTSSGKSPITFSEGILFCKQRIKKYPSQIDPDTYIFLHYPFSLSCFYIQFTPTHKNETSLFSLHEKKNRELPCIYPVDRKLFLSCIEEWGIKVEGLNIPYPWEEMEGKKEK